MKTSLIWTVFALTTILLTAVIIANIRYYIKEEQKEYEIARRRVEEQIAAFRKVDLKLTENKPPLKVYSHTDNEWNVEEKLGRSA